MADIDVATTLYRDEEGYPVAELSAGLGRRIAGYLTLTRMSESDLTPDCARHFSRLRRDDGDAGLGVVAVSNVRVEPWGRGQGVGAALYEEAARVARRSFRSAIVSHECVGGQTSPDARRVWDSSRFRSAVDVRGTVALARAPMQRNPSRRNKRRNPEATEAIRSVRYYHGTDREDLARRILSEGIRPRSVTLVHAENVRAKMAPVRGKVYLTPEIRYAQIYALGANMAGSSFSEASMGRRGRWGYVFVVDGRDLRDVEPDEDAIGEAVHRYLTGAVSISQYNDWPTLSRALLASPYRLGQIGTIASKAMTDRQKRLVRDGMMADMAAVGKKVLKSMPPDLRLWMVEHGASLAHDGALHPIEVWAIDKSRAPELRRDGSNFFSVAELWSGQP